MNEKEMQKFIDENIDRIDPTDAYYIQYQQAKTILDTITDDIDKGSPTAATDQAIFVIGNKVLNIGCFSVAAISAFSNALLEIMQDAIEEIYID